MAQEQALPSPNPSATAHDRRHSSTVERKETRLSNNATPKVQPPRSRDAVSFSSEPHRSPSLGVRDRSRSTVRTDSLVASPRDVRTLPPWIDSFEEPDADQRNGLLVPPFRAHAAQHHYTPTHPERRTSQDGFVEETPGTSPCPQGRRHETGFFAVHREPVKGRKWDHARQGDPVILKMDIPDGPSPWRTYIQATKYGPGLEEEAEKKDADFLLQQTPGYQKPWRGDIEDEQGNDGLADILYHKRRRRTMSNKVQRMLIMHPLVPLFFRVIILTTSAIALALSASVHHFNQRFSYPQEPSTTMAIVVDVVAIPYILYITWDEYTGKPLGLRRPRAKMRLVLLDLFFIIFESANIALAFAAFTDDNGACRSGRNGYNLIICSREKALCAFLMVALIAWSLTFAVSILRLVERMGGREGIE